MFCRILCCFIAKFLFYAIYTVLSRNLFCRNLRALAWRKIGPTILSVEKKGQISGMGIARGGTASAAAENQQVGEMASWEERPEEKRPAEEQQEVRSSKW